MKKFLALLLVLLLALSLCACGEKPDPAPAGGGEALTLPVEDGAVLGEGASALTVSVTGMDGKTITVTVHTDEKTVGEALEKAGLIAGEESEFGLYVKTVNGETVDYDTDGAFWAFYVDGVMAATGVDQTAIEPNVTYAFAAEAVSG